MTAPCKKTKTGRQFEGGKGATLRWQLAAHENGACQIVLTGGPGGQETTAADLLRWEIGECVVIVPDREIGSPFFNERNVPEKKMIAQVIAAGSGQLCIVRAVPRHFLQSRQSAKTHASHPEDRREPWMIDRPNLRPLVRRQAGHSPSAGMNWSNL